MNSTESALLTGFIFASYFAYSAKSFSKKILELNEKLLKNNTEVIRNSAKTFNKLFQTQEEYKDYVLEKEEEKAEILADIDITLVEIQEQNTKALQSNFMALAGHGMSNPIQQKEYPFIIIHEVYKDALNQISYLIESENCWIEPLYNTTKNKDYRTVLDIVVLAESESKLNFAKFLITERLKEISRTDFKKATSVPMSVKENRALKCLNCNIQAKCKEFREKIDLLDFKCPKEIREGRY